MKTFILFLTFLLTANTAHAQYHEYVEVEKVDDGQEDAADCISFKTREISKVRGIFIFTNSCSKAVNLRYTTSKERHSFIVGRLKREFGIRVKEWPYTESLYMNPTGGIYDKHTVNFHIERAHDTRWGACFYPLEPYNISTKKHTMTAGYICAKLSTSAKKKQGSFWGSLSDDVPNELGPRTNENWWRWYTFLDRELLGDNGSKGFYWRDKSNQRGKPSKAPIMKCSSDYSRCSYPRR